MSDRIAEIAKRFPGKLSEIEYAAHEIDFRRRIKAALREAVQEERKEVRSILVRHGSSSAIAVLDAREALLAALDARDAEEGPDYALDSPNHVPQELKDFAARNYERKNRR